MGSGDVIAIVPLKALSRAKARLAGALTPTRRRELACWMFDRVLDACLGATHVTGILVVAGDEAAAARGRARGADVLVEPRVGLAAALGAADDATAGAPATLVVAADLPLAVPEDLDTVCRAGGRRPGVVVVPTGDGGTAALLRRPAGVVPTAYGPGSAAAHLRLAAHAGVPATCLDVPALRLDVDTVTELDQAAEHDGRLHAWRRPR